MDEVVIRDVLNDPPWRGDDLGHPLPDSPYAVSVSLPKWSHVIGYEEGDQNVLDKLKTGYPRFFVPRVVKELEKNALISLGLSSDFCCSVYPGDSSGDRCLDYILQRTDGCEVYTRPVFDGVATAVVYPNEIAEVAAQYWRYLGEGVSVRQAEALMNGRNVSQVLGSEARTALKEQIASDTGQNAEDVFLFPSGMAAVAATHRALISLAPGKRSVQFDFPYVDVLRLQREIGSGVAFLPSGDDEAILALKHIVGEGELLCGVYCEVPSNPLLRSANLSSISAITGPARIPLVVDDTVATNVNADVFKFADLVTTSLTKYYSGVGDVIAGAVTIKHGTNLADSLRTVFSEQANEELWGEDAIVLKSNAADYRNRMQRVNETAPKLVEWLHKHPAVERVWYPRHETRESYDAVRRTGGGFSGLFSMLLKDAANNSPAFYDALEICKGPSLGVKFTIACPYTLLAHYDELEWCEGLGVSRWLIRVSVGQESYKHIRSRFERAFSKLQ